MMVSRCCWFVWVQTCKYARWSFSIAESNVARVICTGEIVACVYGRWVPHFSLICWLFSRNGKWLAVPGAMFHFPASVRSTGSSPSHRALNYSITQYNIPSSYSHITEHANYTSHRYRCYTPLCEHANARKWRNTVSEQNNTHAT